MSDAVIAVERLSKRYIIGHQMSGDGLRHAIEDFARSPARWFRSYSLARSEKREEFWALRDVTFSIKEGEVVGFIGRNGAGKSTLLKVLSRITDPTVGRVRISGRVASLLEVGTGFHPELTGRENIFLNGAILGMGRAEIKAKFDEVVAFSGVEKFLDTPVKRYSSGMYVRLAFSVAAHLEPEILIIDEVLSVGDADFQRKCLGRMHDVARRGRTVLFVSHNMGAVAELCGRCIGLRHGGIVADGKPQQVIAEYLANGPKSGDVDLNVWSGDRTGDGPLRVTRLGATDELGIPKHLFKHGDTIKIRVSVKGPAGSRMTIGVSIRNNLSLLVLHYANTQDGAELTLRESSGIIELTIAENVLNDGHYSISVWLGDDRARLHDSAENVMAFEVNSSAHGRIRAKGLVRLPGEWSLANACDYADSTISHR